MPNMRTLINSPNSTQSPPHISPPHISLLQRGSPPAINSGAATAPVPAAAGHAAAAAAPTAPINVAPPASGSGAFRWAPQGRASRKYSRLLG
eukprot:1158249-Pelagomonas_calceolata.AAC.1